MILADKIVSLRKKSGWSQEELAQQLNVTRQSVSKWESAQSIPELDKILQMARLFSVSTDYLLKDELEEPAPAAVPESPALRRVSLEEANAFLAAKEQTAMPVALAVFLCIMSPVCLLLLGAAAEGSYIPLREDAACGLGLVILLLLVAVAVAIFIACDAKTKDYEFLETEPIETEYGVTGMVRARKEQFREVYTRGNIVGTTLCILASVPLFVGICFSDADLFLVAMVALLLLLVGLGVIFFIRVGIPWAGMEKLLEEGDYSRRKKRGSRKLSVVSAVYWLVVVAGYLAYSFAGNGGQGAWRSSWVVWPVAGVLYAAVIVVCKEIFEREE